ncbi:hypothetical protein ACJMK2_038918 [Sinanodonta woodiana]|uniref:Uncharacterized protein n=1 Tax=Sinanodonta woodiana TaxID=1069815 RepID=A0ABD3WAF1_SINWO
MQEKVEEDDRWTGFIDERSKKRRGTADYTQKPEITLNDTMLRVNSHKDQVFRQSQEVKLKMFTKKTYEISVPWRMYFLCIRTLSRDHIECIVLLNRPVKPDAFQLQQLPICDMPLHHCLVHTNPSLTRSELVIIEQQWNIRPEVDESCIDKNGFFRPDKVLAWFNRDLCEACQCIPIKRSNIEKLEGKNAKDGSIEISTTMRTNPKVKRGDEIISLSISIIPGFVVSKLPTNFRIQTGKEIVFLNPRTELDGSGTKIRGHSCPISWQVNMTLLQERILNIIVSMSKSMNFNIIVSLISIFRNERLLDLEALTEDALIHAACTAFRKNVGKLNICSEWFLLILKSVSEGLKRGFISNYFCPRQNLLAAIDKGLISKTYKELQKLKEDIESDPETLYKYTNFDAVKEDKEEDLDDKEENALGNEKRNKSSFQ